MVTVFVPLQPVAVNVTSTMKSAPAPPCFPVILVVANVPLIYAPGSPTAVPLYHRYSFGPAGTTEVTLADPLRLPPAQLVELNTLVVRVGFVRVSSISEVTAFDVQFRRLLVTVVVTNPLFCRLSNTDAPVCTTG